MSTLPELRTQYSCSGDLLKARHLLDLALQTTAYRSEAWIWLALERWQSAPLDAFLPLACASAAYPGRSELRALLAQCLSAATLPAAALDVLKAALQRDPKAPSLRKLYWEAAAATLDSATLVREIQSQLADITHPGELRQVLTLLAACPESPHSIGVIRHDPKENLLIGWAIDLQVPERHLSIQITANGAHTSCQTSLASPLLAQAGLSRDRGGILARLPRYFDALELRFEDGTPLIGSPLAAVAPFIPPSPARKKTRNPTVDVLVPVYKGIQSTLNCLDSLLRSRKQNRTPHQIVVLDDASPEPELTNALLKLARSGKIKLIRRAANLGFIRNMNRGMALHPDRDVVWLNADTHVHGNWLDRLHRLAYSHDDVASVTPFSNNGELMSFPVSRHAAPMPAPTELALLDETACELALPPVELEVGCGFCLYIKRQALEQTGYLDEQHLIRGYGEETDWCLRARQHGWRHLGATNIFVAHAGGHSFGPEKALRVQQNNQVIRQRYPQAEQRYERFVALDPIRPARQALQARLAERGHALLVRPAATDMSWQLTPHHLVHTKPCWLIADRLSGIDIGRRWLSLARRLRRQQPDLTLLLTHETPWENQLISVGNIRRLPRLDGLQEDAVLLLSGTKLALSLSRHAAEEHARFASVIPLYGPGDILPIELNWLDPLLQAAMTLRVDAI